MRIADKDAKRLIHDGGRYAHVTAQSSTSALGPTCRENFIANPHRSAAQQGGGIFRREISQWAVTVGDDRAIAHRYMPDRQPSSRSAHTVSLAWRYERNQRSQTSRTTSIAVAPTPRTVQDAPVTSMALAATPDK